MNGNNKNIAAKRVMSGWWFISLLVCYLSGCSDEITYIKPPDSDFATLVLNIKTPSSSVPRPVSRSTQTVEETTVSNVRVLVFSDTQGNGSYRFIYMAEGSQIENNQNQTSRFQVMLRSSTVPLRLFLVTNYAETFSNYVPEVGQDEASVKASVNMPFTSDGLQTNLPMYGEISLAGLDATTTNMFDVTVLRAIARVDVRNNLVSDSPAFALREVYVYRANDRIQIIPDSVSTTGTMQVVAPSVPGGSSILSQPVIKTSAVSTDSIGGIYVPESLGQVGGPEIPLSATTVVVGGIFGNDTAISYYRADFDSGIEGHPFGQVLRNHLYTFSIRKVNGTGLPTAQEASVNLSSSMTVEVRQWEDFTSDMYLGSSYIGVSTRQVNVPFLPNYTRTIDIESSLNYEMQWMNPTETETVSEAGVPLSNGYFTATIVRNPDESSYLSHIRIESSEYNITDQPVQATLRLTASNTTVDIIVMKESPSQYSDRTLRVLSVGWSYGSLGSFDNSAVYSLAMRNILDTNFSPSSNYPFKTGGFFYLAITASSASYSNATDPIYIASFKRLIENFDVLLMTYENIVSTQVANMLLDEWLVEDKHRILWVMRDDIYSNVNIVARTAQDGEGQWANIGNAFDATAGYRYSNSADYEYNNAQEVYEFFNGPFGTIDHENTQLSLRAGDIVAGASLIPDSAKQYVTPLVYSNKTGYTDYLSVGVNKQRGIIYQGEAQTFQAGIGMSGTTGAIVSTTDTNGQYYFDLLNANIWAWVTGRVIYGPSQ